MEVHVLDFQFINKRTLNRLTNSNRASTIHKARMAKALMVSSFAEKSIGRDFGAYRKLRKK